MTRQRAGKVLGVVAAMLCCCGSFASYPVFDATNNVLASLQKAMDSAFQNIQKINMETLIEQAKKDYAEQIAIYEECVKQYEECVKIYEKAMETYNWIDTNIGRAKNLKTFLSCDFTNPANLQRLTSLVNSTLAQGPGVTNPRYRQSVLNTADNVIQDEVMRRVADRGVERQKYAQAARKVADQCDTMAQSMLNALRTKDRVMESRVASGTADLMQITHAGEQGIMFLAEELARVNSNVSAINRTAARQEEAWGENEMNRAQEAAVYAQLEKETIERGTRYTRQQDARRRIDDVFKNSRAF